MKKLVIFLVLFLLSFSSVNSVAQANDIFQEIRRIQLPANHLIGSITNLNVLGPQYLILDFQGQFFVYREGDEKVKKMRIEDCFPGVETHPNHTFHLSDSTIFLANATSLGYRFKYDGSCIGEVHKDFRPASSHKTVSTYGGKFLTIFPTPKNSFVLTEYNQNGKPLKSADLPKSRFPFFDNRVLGGGMAVTGNELYYMLGSGGLIYVVDLKEFNFTKSISLKTDYAPAVDEDLPSNAVSDRTLKAFQKITRNNYTIHSMFELLEGVILIQTRFIENDNARYAVHLLDVKEGQEQKLVGIFEKPFLFARNGKLYAVNDVREETEEIVNPELVIYQYNP